MTVCWVERNMFGFYFELCVFWCRTEHTQLSVLQKRKWRHTGLCQKLCKDKCINDQEVLRHYRKEGHINTEILLIFFS